MRLLIATDAWEPQVNGVVKTLTHCVEELRAAGDEVCVLSHRSFTERGYETWGLPSYPEIQLVFPKPADVARAIEDFAPDAVHVATEGPIGTRVRRYALNRDLPFTTGYHTRFPEFVSARVPVPGLAGGIERLTYRWLRAFHAPSRAVLAPTRAIADELTARGFANAVTWTRGVDHALFNADVEPVDYGAAGPVVVNCGRVSVEKGVEAFLRAEVPGHPDALKVVIGDGPARARLERAFPQARFTGYLFGEALARHIAGGDVFCFPSVNDTFGLVMVEAMACGLPIAARPVPGPVDVVEHGRSGFLDEDLGRAIAGALELKREDALARAATFTWEETARRLRAALVPFGGGEAPTGTGTSTVGSPRP